MAQSNYRDAINLLVDIRPLLKPLLKGSMGQNRQKIRVLMERLDVVVANTDRGVTLDHGALLAAARRPQDDDKGVGS